MNLKQTKFIEALSESIRAVFIRAFAGNSKAAALKAKCLDCCCYDKKEVKLCSVETCPLHKYRPYQSK
jgi:hypothetical protein